MRSAMVRCDECGRGPINVPDDPATFQIANRDPYGVDRTYDFCGWECAYEWLSSWAEHGHPPLELSEFGRQPHSPNLLMMEASIEATNDLLRRWSEVDEPA